jgi:glycosyltransferase involved in cell wall biosynthesis
MKILIDARMIEGHHGIGRYTLTLIQGLLTRNHEVTVLFHSYGTLKIIGDGLKDVIYCKLPFAHPAESIELATKIKFSKYDIVHLPSFAVPIKSSKNLVVTIHDLIHLHQPTLGHKIYYNTVLKKTLSKAGAVITVSDWAKKELHKYLNTDLKKISVIRNGLEPRWFGENSESHSKENPFFLALGNTKRHKNIMTLIKASQKLWSQNFEFNLVLSLGGQDIPEEWNLDTKTKSKIKILKNVPDDELQGYFQKCTALVSTSYLEGYNYAVAQALAQSKPAILSRGSAHDEFKGTMAHFYGAPDDSQNLAKVMKEVFDAPPSAKSDHNISTQNEMVEKTLQVYRNCVS